MNTVQETVSQQTSVDNSSNRAVHNGASSRSNCHYFQCCLFPWFQFEAPLRVRNSAATQYPRTFLASCHTGISFILIFSCSSLGALAVLQLSVLQLNRATLGQLVEFDFFWERCTSVVVGPKEQLFVKGSTNQLEPSPAALSHQNVKPTIDGSNFDLSMGRLIVLMLIHQSPSVQPDRYVFFFFWKITSYILIC